MVQVLTGEAVIIVDWLLLATAYVLVSVRLWFRFIHQKRSLTSSDGFLLIATVIVMVVMIIFQKEHDLGAMHPNHSPTTEIKKYAFTTVLLYHTATYATKFSILAFYAKLFPESSHALRFACLLTIIYTTCCYITAMLLTTFWCGPTVVRTFEVGPGACTVWNYTLFKINFSMNISSDIFIFVLPFPLLMTLDLGRRQIVALCVTFGLGLITMVVSICRCVALLKNAFIPLYVWSMAEMCTAIMVSSLPSLRPLLKSSRRFMVSSSPTTSGAEKRSSGRQKKSHSNHGPKKREDSPNGSAHLRHHSDETASDIELIHVNTGPGGKMGQPRIREREYAGAKRDEKPVRMRETVDMFANGKAERHPDHWV